MRNIAARYITLSPNRSSFGHDAGWGYLQSSFDVDRTFLPVADASWKLQSLAQSRRSRNCLHLISDDQAVMFSSRGLVTGHALEERLNTAESFLHVSQPGVTKGTLRTRGFTLHRYFCVSSGGRADRASLESFSTQAFKPSLVQVEGEGFPAYHDVQSTLWNHLKAAHAKPHIASR